MVTAVLPHPSSSRRGRALFQPGTVAVSRGAHAALELADVGIHPLLRRHFRGDWGLLQADEADNNSRALTEAAPVRSLFELPTGARLLLETDGTRKVTSILLDGAEMRGQAHRDRPIAALPVPAPSITLPPSPVSDALGTSRHSPVALADIIPPEYLADCLDTRPEPVAAAAPTTQASPTAQVSTRSSHRALRRAPAHHHSNPTSAMPLDHLRLRKLYAANASARAFLDHAASRTNDQQESKLDRVLAILADTGHRVNRAEVVVVFRELEACECGRFLVGRRGHCSRFAWKYSIIETGRIAAGEREPDATDEAIATGPTDAADDDDAMTTTLREHALPLRSDLTLHLQLPTDLTRDEARRIAFFARALAIG